MSSCVSGRGYSPYFIGWMGAVLVIGGLIGSILGGFLADKTKYFALIYKLCLVGTAVSGGGSPICDDAAGCRPPAGLQASAVGCALVLTRPKAEVFVAVAIFAFGAFGFPTYPLGLEMAVEATYPIPEAAASGALILVGQITGILYSFGTAAFAQPSTEEIRKIQTCAKDASGRRSPIARSHAQISVHIAGNQRLDE